MSRGQIVAVWERNKKNIIRVTQIKKHEMGTACDAFGRELRSVEGFSGEK
jgi:hypothetical protein